VLRLPCQDWLKTYSVETLGSDLVAAVIVTIMLIPQSLAYALLAGLPAEMGLYASILPLVAYALLGSSRTLSVGPVAVVSLMTATAVGNVTRELQVDYATAAITLALLSGAMLILLGLIRFGFVANLLSHPVVSGFITSSGILIGLSQLSHMLGIDAGGDTLPSLLSSLLATLESTNLYTLAIGAFALLFLQLCRSRLAGLLSALGMARSTADLLTKAAPVMAVVLTILLAALGNLEAKGVALVGVIPQGLPAFSEPRLSLELLTELLMPALLIALIGFVESVSVGRTLGGKRGERIDPNQELIGLGAANIAAGVSGGFPVTGGFSRSVVNFDAGARTQAASIMTAGGIALAAAFLTPALYFLPKATLAATIIVAISSLLDWKAIREAWHYDKADFTAIAATITMTLGFGVEVGVIAGVATSIGLHLHRTMRPHFAIVGAVPGTEHYRNVQRHDVVTHNNILSIRVDESLYFANSAFLEDLVYSEVDKSGLVEHVVLMCPAINSIDLSALEALQEINRRLLAADIKLHLSEVKGPVMDALQRSHFLDKLAGKVFLNHHAAVQELAQA